MKRVILRPPRQWLIALTPVTIITVLYVVSHLYRLLSLPVFADEAIYVRWAQLIMDDAPRYAFFPLMDGKTPLYIWLLVPFQYLFGDQLWAGRVVSVGIGLIQMFTLARIAQSLGLRRSTQLLVMAMAGFLPLWFFYQRMALMDGLLTLLLSFSWWAGWEVSTLPLTVATKSLRIRWVVFGAVVFGFALLTKLPALFFLGCLPLLVFAKQATWTHRFQRALWLAGMGGGGLAVFATLRLTPGFGQLFRRSQDFTFTLSEFFQGAWQSSFSHIPQHVFSVANELTWPVFLLAILGLFFSSRRKSGVLLLSAVLFAAPFLLLGRVVYPRYFLPTAPWLTLAAGVAWQAAADRWVVHQRNILAKTGSSLLLALGCAFAATTAALFIVLAWWYPSALPLSHVDRVQYLEEWSSGVGIPEVVSYIQQGQQHRSIAVATEGRFGTLPDGLLMYFHRRPVKNLYIEGTGQYPVKSLPDFFVQRARQFDQSILVVNSHRMELRLPDENLLFQVCRPNKAPCLQVWDVTAIVKETKITQP